MCFLFEAEDGIRDWSVTGVQACALPIWCQPPFDKTGAYRGDTWLWNGGWHQVCPAHSQIGRASCRERVEISVVAVSLKKKVTDDKSSGSSLKDLSTVVRASAVSARHG